MKRLVAIGLFWLLLIGCTDTSTQQPPPPPPPVPIVYTDPPQFGTPFTEVPETKDIVIYEVNLRAFSPAGTFDGVAARLDELEALGVNTIWLMPIHPIGVLNSVGQLGSPYSVKNYKEVSSEYGTLDDLRDLVEAAHDRGIAVILDWVANHTAWDNPWIVNTTWYTKNSNGQIVIPPGTNWQDVADLNFGSAAMRTAMFNAMKYWILAANVDGYRCDYADGVPFDFWQQAIDTLESIPNRELILLAEGSSLGHFTAGFQMNYAWDYFGALTNVFSGQPATALLTTNSNEQASMPSDAFKLRFTANHDEVAWNNTPLGLFGGEEGSLAAFVLTSYMGGVPLIYNGQEVGCPVMLPFFSKSPIDWTTNPDMTDVYTDLIAFRGTSEAVKQGTIEGYPHADVVAFKRIHGSNEVFVLVNTRNSSLTYDLDPAIANTNWLDVMDGNNPISLSTQVNMPPYSFFILKN